MSMTTDQYQWLVDAGADMDSKQFILFDGRGNFVVQTDTIDEAFDIARERNIQYPGIFDLDIVRKDDYIF